MSSSTRARTRPPPIRFGVEIEKFIYWPGKRNTLPSWGAVATALREELSSELDDVGVRIVEEKKQDTPEWDEWKITRKPRLGRDSIGNWYAVELKSPIYNFKDQTRWILHLKSIFDVLLTKVSDDAAHNEELRGKNLDECATRIHTSPESGVFTMQQVRSVAAAQLLYERLVDAIMPPNRRYNKYCLSNVMNPFISSPLHTVYCGKQKTMDPRSAQLSLDEKIRHLDCCGRQVNQVVEIMCPFIMGLRGIEGFKHTWAVTSRRYRVNFCPLRPITAATSQTKIKDRLEPPEIGSGNKPYGTIEFRQPPASETAEEAEEWIRLACYFVTSAIDDGLQGIQRKANKGGTNLESLQVFLQNGATLCGDSTSTWLRKMFKDKTELPDVTFDAKAAWEPGEGIEGRDLDSVNMLAMIRTAADAQNIDVDEFKAQYVYQ